MLQYGRTAGIINELVAQQVQCDEGVPASADRVLITSGCQEAVALCLPALCPEPSDVLLVCNPTYIGAIGAAKATGVAAAALSNSEPCLADAIELAVLQLRQKSQQAGQYILSPILTIRPDVFSMQTSDATSSKCAPDTGSSF
ncbi:hypothetical protein [Bradyrhizobium sp. 187]|uniref:hypothetical protein n=1 Tax=Bradyrhizobium sp. 187 TaxID=2782655 RepID=UPI001FFEBE41|nr:hypothetical protein [Bradyrhizobium sp. 187]